MNDDNPRSLMHDLVLPTLLFASLGGMTWAVRGSSGYGGSAGCIFAGVMWGAAWWYIARDPKAAQSRRYASGWIVLAVTVGVGLSGARGWMQWPSFFEGRLQTNYGAGEFVPISRTYGFVWLFIAGMPWAGIGACMLAWCGSLRETRVWHWAIRVACGIGGAILARWMFDNFPQYFLPLYASLEARYQDFESNPNLRRLINDSGAAVFHLGLYLGFLLFEIGRRDWKNVVLILTVGVVNGAGWALCQNWKWAPGVWEGASFNWWRCWESSGGISIGIAYGIAYFFVNRRMGDEERAVVAARRSISGPNFEWLLVYLGLTSVLSVFLGYGMRQWGSSYFSVAIAFGVAYYLMNRGTAFEAAPGERRWAGIEWGAVCLGALLTAGLFFGRRAMRSYGLLYFGVVLALGIAYYLLKRRTFEEEKAQGTPPRGDPSLERLGLYLGLLFGLGLSLRNGLKGWFNIYMGNEDYWSEVLWWILGPAFLVCLIWMTSRVLFRALPRGFSGDLVPRAYGILWLVLIVQNTLAQLITGPLTQWNEMAFNIYYLLLFFITAVIVFHYSSMKRLA